MLRADTCALTSVNDFGREENGNEIPYRKTGGWNIGRALGERDDVTQEFELSLPLKAAAYVSLTNCGAHNGEGIADVEGRGK
jgi:hypothetical protein